MGSPRIKSETLPFGMTGNTAKQAALSHAEII